MTAFARAWAMFGDPAFRQAADRIFGSSGTRWLLRRRLLRVPGHRRGQPGVDRRLYARETAQAIAGLLAYYDATGVAGARELAVSGAGWVLANRALPAGGFRHADQDPAGPISPTMSRWRRRCWPCTARPASVDGLPGTGDRGLHRQDLRRSRDRRLRASAPLRTPGNWRSRSSSARTMSRAAHVQPAASYTGDARYREIAEAGMGYLTSPPILDAYGFLPDVLLAEAEMRKSRSTSPWSAPRTIRGPRRCCAPASAIRCQTSARVVGQARRPARQSRRQLSGLSRWAGGLCLYQHLLLATGDGSCGDPRQLDRLKRAGKPQ